MLHSFDTFEGAKWRWWDRPRTALELAIPSTGIYLVRYRYQGYWERDGGDNPWAEPISALFSLWDSTLKAVLETLPPDVSPCDASAPTEVCLVRQS